jgi:hypothetical protein
MAADPVRIVSEEDFLDALGLEDFVIEGEPTCEDPLWFRVASQRARSHGGLTKRDLATQSRQDVPSGKQYWFYWDARQHLWHVECRQLSPPTCCCLRNGPLLVNLLRATRLLDQDIGLRSRLRTWAELDADRRSLAYPTELLERLSKELCSDPITGRLHTQLVASPKLVTKQLCGAVVQVPSERPLPENVGAAWTLSWVERLTAWMGTDLFFGESVDAEDHVRFLQALADGCVAWPRLMQRCLVLAEWAIWSYYHGGLGAAIQFDANVEEEYGSGTVSGSTYSRQMAFSKEVTGAVGVIVDYGGGIGRLLIKHPSSPSLAASVREYVQSRPGSRSWLARFDWDVIEEQDRRKLEHMHAEKSHSCCSPAQAVSLGDLMRGMPVRCNLRKVTRWEATRVRIDFSAKRFSLSGKRQT